MRTTTRVLLVQTAEAATVEVRETFCWTVYWRAVQGVTCLQVDKVPQFRAPCLFGRCCCGLVAVLLLAVLGHSAFKSRACDPSWTLTSLCSSSTDTEQCGRGSLCLRHSHSRHMAGPHGFRGRTAHRPQTARRLRGLRLLHLPHYAVGLLLDSPCLAKVLVDRCSRLEEAASALSGLLTLIRDRVLLSYRHSIPKIPGKMQGAKKTKEHLNPGDKQLPWGVLCRGSLPRPDSGRRG